MLAPLPPLSRYEGAGASGDDAAAALFGGLMAPPPYHLRLLSFEPPLLLENLLACTIECERGAVAEFGGNRARLRIAP